MLGIKHRTVKAHFNRLFLRFGVRDGYKRVKLAVILYRLRQLCLVLLLCLYASAHSVSLTCTPADGTATSFNFYRGPSSGGPWTLQGANTTCAYTDATVVNGTHYFYVATAVNANGESDFSAPAEADIPSDTPGVTLRGLDHKRGDHPLTLTRKQWAIVKWVAAGLKNKEIALRAGTSRRMSSRTTSV